MVKPWKTAVAVLLLLTALAACGDTQPVLSSMSDVAAWPGTLKNAILGDAVADPKGGKLGRSLSFAHDQLYFAVLTRDDIQGKWTGTLWLRAPGDKAQIALMIFGGSGAFNESKIVDLTFSWQRVSVTTDIAVKQPSISFGLDNRSSVVPGLDDTPGVVEVAFGEISP